MKVRGTHLKVSNALSGPHFPLRGRHLTADKETSTKETLNGRDTSNRVSTI